MKKLIAAVSAVFIAVTLSIVAVAAPASAHTASLTGAAACNNADGTATVTWTLANTWNLTASVSQTSNNTVIPQGTTLDAVGGANATKTFQQLVAAPAGGKSVSMSVTLKWSDKVTEDYSYTVKVSSDCKVPTPKDATAALVFTAPTCTTAQTVAQGATTFASWNGSIHYTSNGTKYSTSANASSGHQFSDGSTTLNFSGTLLPALSGENCDNTDTKVPLCHATASQKNPYTEITVSYNAIITGGHGKNGINDGDIIPPFDYIVGGVTHHYPGQNWDADHQAIYNNGCTPPPVPQCIPNSAVSFTYSQNDANEGDITVASVPGSTGVLCNPFYVTAVSWKYTNNSSIWPQTLDQFDALGEISTPGVYHYAAQVTCGQGDIYASFDANQASLSQHPYLNGPSNPFPESFLADMGFTGGLTPTWVQDSNNCFIPTPETGTPTTTVASCTEGSVNSITVPAVPGGVWTITDGTDTHTYPIGTGVTGFTPANFDQYTITLVDGSSTDGYLVTPTTTQYTPVDASTLDCNTLVQPVKPDVTKIRTCDASGSVDITPQVGVDYYINGTQVTNGTTLIDGTLETGLQGKVTVTAKAETGYEFSGPTTEVSWKFWLGHESTCTFTTSYGDCTADNGNSTESVSMTFVNPGKHTATFTVTGGTDNVNVSVQVPGHTTSAVTIIDATALAGDTFNVSVNGGTAQVVTVPTFDGCLNAIGGDPSAKQATCNADSQAPENNASITVDLEPGLIYELTGPNGYDQTNISWLSEAQTGDFTIGGLAAGVYHVTVTAADGYVLDSKYNDAQTWPFQLTLSTPVCDISVSVTPADCVTIQSSGFHTDTVGVPSITVALDPEVVYTAREVSPTANSFVLTSATTDVDAGEYFVDVTLSSQGIADGASLPGGVSTITYGATGVGSETPFDLTAFCPPTEASWNAGASGTNAVCTSGTTTDGVITLVHSVGQEGKVTYTITNTKTSAVVYSGNTDTTVNVPAGSYSVKATPPVGDGISGNTQNNADGSEIFPTIVIGTTSTDCDGTLAFTGGTIAWLGFVLAGGMLFLGIALLYMRRRGNRTAE